MDQERMGREEFENLIRFSMSPSEFRRVMRAYQLSKHGHKGQSRETGERYFEHPKAVAVILIKELRMLDPDMIITALLHDIQEDSFILTWEDIEDIFGKNIVLYVRAVTKEPGKAYLENLLRAPTPALFVKLADRLHNLRTLGGCRPEKKMKQITETREKYIRVMHELQQRLPRNERWRSSYLREKILRQCTEIEETVT
ncbi:MAG: bifunctional (p)ppGpp synthetase/guanosine-3',5'-bis(diphosphate) 3'-pyrophosphohydrolase [Patescibacteria group bacterium]|nr:bifunctional (p)ppGpp synthetase/guanosine-3',5'-bis(diphosphate) 3'-pyrophosphohydrolase [Patescibacteria group bacterium]